LLLGLCYKSARHWLTAASNSNSTQMCVASTTATGTYDSCCVSDHIAHNDRPNTSSASSRRGAKRRGGLYAVSHVKIAECKTRRRRSVNPPPPTTPPTHTQTQTDRQRENIMHPSTEAVPQKKQTFIHRGPKFHKKFQSLYRCNRSKD